MKRRNPKRGTIELHGSSMNLTEAEGSRWDTADGKLMLRHCKKAVNTELLGNQKHVGLGKGGKWNDRTQLK